MCIVVQAALPSVTIFPLILGFVPNQLVNLDKNFIVTATFFGFPFNPAFEATWFPIYSWSVSTFVILTDTFFISMTLMSASLRKYPANFLLVGNCLANLLHSASHIVSAFAIWYGSINNRGLCETAGTFVIMTATCRLGFPALIAANRFYKISKLPTQTTSSCSICRTIFSEKATIPLIIGWFCFAFSINLPLIITHSFGEDEAGFCGAKKFTSVLLLTSYEMSVIAVYIGSITLTGLYYYRLLKWLKQNQSNSGDNQDSINLTRSLMRVMEIETILPLLSEMPTAVLTAGQMVLPEISMWLSRLLVTPYWFPSCANPWLTIALVRPFRRRFVELISKLK